MGDPNKIDEVYALLENNYVIIPKHIKNLFNKLNLVGLRVWANIQDSQFETYEDVIKEILANDNSCQIMNQEERKALFGEIFWNHPKDFKFLPGDKAVIIQMREVSKELVKKMTKDRERMQATSQQAVWQRECKQNQIPIIDIDVEIKEEHDISEVDEKAGHGIPTPSSKTNDCDKRADSSTLISEPNISVSSVKTIIAETVDESEANATISQSNYEVSGQEPASSSITASDDWNLLASPDNEPKINCAPKSVGNHEWAKSADDWEESNRKTPESGLPGVFGSENNNSRTNWSNYAPRLRKSGGKGNHSYKFNKKGHTSYNNPTGPTRGGGGGGSTRLCFKCNQEGHMSYNCPTASTGRRGARNSLPQSLFADWGTLTGTPATKSLSTFVSWENKNDWRSTPDQASIPSSTGANAAPAEARNTPRSSYNAPIGNSQPVLDDWGIASNSSAAAPVTKTANNSVADDWGSAVDAWSSVKTAQSTTPLGNSTAANSGVNDWGSAADSWSSVKTAKSTPLSENNSRSNWKSVKTAKSPPRPGNSSAAKSGGDDWETLADSWNGFLSASNAECVPPNNFMISCPGPKPVVNSGANDWGVAADVSQSDSLLNTRASPILSQTDWNGIETGKGMTNNQELSQSRMNPVHWTGTINHGRRSFKADMKSLDANTPSVLADLEMPKSVRVVGTIEPEKVWTYLRRVSESINERIGVFQFTPTTYAEADGYKFFYNELNGMNWFAVIADAPDSKLPWSFKDFYVVPLAKESPMPLELTTFVTKSFRENRKSDFILGVVVFRAQKSQRAVDQPNFNASLAEKKAVCVTQSDAELECIRIQETKNSESTLVASAQPSELTSFIKKSFVENQQTSNFLLDVVVSRTQRLVEQSGLNTDPSVDQSAAAPKAKNIIPVSPIELKANSRVIQEINVVNLSNLLPALRQEEDLRSVNPVQSNDQNRNESSKPNFKIPKLKPNFLDRSPTVATSSVKPSADTTTSVANKEIRKEKAFLNLLNVNIATHLQKPTSMPADLASITPRNIRIPDIDEICSSQSVQAAFPSSNLHGPLTRSRLRNSPQQEKKLSLPLANSVKSIAIPTISQNPASAKDMEKKITKRSNLSRSTSASSTCVSSKVQKTSDIDSKVTSS